MDQYQTAVVPVHFFDLPDHGSHDILREGLSRIRKALQQPY